MIKRNFFRECNEEKWDEVRTHPYFQAVREGVLANAEKLLAEDPPYLKFSDYHKFVTEGSRKAYGTPMGQYTKRMNVYFFCYMLTKDEKYIEPLVDIMWAICNLETWAINAHVKEEASILERRRFLDLGSCCLAHRMAEILYYIGDKFPELAYRRIYEEIRFRIIDNYIEKREPNAYWWYTASNNWSAVCISRVFGVFLCLATDEEIEAEMPRFLATAQCYIDGMPDDGCCAEGSGYWSYGFSHYMLFADLVRDYTDGKINLFDNEKVKRIATFYSHIAINNHQGLSFSDGGLSYAPSAWIMHKLKHIYPDMPVPHTPPPTHAEGVLRYVLWCDPNIAGSEHKLESYIFPIAQWFLHIGDKYSMGAKAGFNHEPHNHNDVGSFLISKNNEVTFCDPGCGEYIKSYFGAGRYTNLMPSARAHSVPIINGYIQCTGDEKGNLYRADPDHFTFSIQNGYPAECRATIDSVVRDLDCQPDALILTDTYKFIDEPSSVVEQFVSLMPIEGENGRLTCGGTVLTYDASLYDMEFGSEDFRRNNGAVNTLYWVRLSVKKLEKELALTFRFE